MMKTIWNMNPKLLENMAKTAPARGRKWPEMHPKEFFYKKPKQIFKGILQN